MSELGGTLESDVHILPLRVYHEDTDYTGVVYHASYLRFAERGRSDMLRCLGIDQKLLQEQSPPVALMVWRMEIEYLGAAVIEDCLRVETSLANLSKTRIDLKQRILRDETALWQAKVVVVAAVPGGRARRLPSPLLDAFRRWRTDALA